MIACCGFLADGSPDDIPEQRCFSGNTTQQSTCLNQRVFSMKSLCVVLDQMEQTSSLFLDLFSLYFKEMNLVGEHTSFLLINTEISLGMQARFCGKYTVQNTANLLARAETGSQTLQSLGQITISLQKITIMAKNQSNIDKIKKALLSFYVPPKIVNK